MEKPIFLSLGTNLGNRLQNLKKALQAIESQLGEIKKKSSVYETTPWGKNDQPDFLNQVILVSTVKTPEECLTILLQIEKQLGRKREEKWGARSIDLDLLYVGNETRQTDELILPHPGIPQRKFVLVPLAEIAPEFIHPVLKKNQGQLLAECPDQLMVTRLET